MADCEGGEIRRNKKGELQVHRRKVRKDGFTDARKKRFLEQFAATGNVTAAAEDAGMSLRTIYSHRGKDAAFREAWAEAQEHCYASLEAELVRRARELLTAAAPADLSAIQGMDAKLAFSLLQNFQRKNGREPGDIVPRKSDVAEATRRLEATMRRLKLVPLPTLQLPAPDQSGRNPGEGA